MDERFERRFIAVPYLPREVFIRDLPPIQSLQPSLAIGIW